MLGLYEYSEVHARGSLLRVSHAPVSPDGIDIYLQDVVVEVRKGEDGMLVVNGPTPEAERTLAGLRGEEVSPEVEISLRIAAALKLADKAGLIFAQENLEEAVEVLLGSGESMRLIAKTATDERRLWVLAGLGCDLSFWIANNPSAPGELLAYLARTEPWLQPVLMRNLSTPTEVLVRWAKEGPCCQQTLFDHLRARGVSIDREWTPILCAWHGPR